MNGNISMQQLKDKFKHQKTKNCNFKCVMIKETQEKRPNRDEKQLCYASLETAIGFKQEI